MCLNLACLNPTHTFTALRCEQLRRWIDLPREPQPHHIINLGVRITSLHKHWPGTLLLLAGLRSLTGQQTAPFVSISHRPLYGDIRPRHL